MVQGSNPTKFSLDVQKYFFIFVDSVCGSLNFVISVYFLLVVCKIWSHFCFFGQKQAQYNNKSNKHKNLLRREVYHPELNVHRTERTSSIILEFRSYTANKCENRANGISVSYIFFFSSMKRVMQWQVKRKNSFFSLYQQLPQKILAER